mmetsp:Transcript_77180/g.174588  ORF Transcript_77180/g.174588 Transcript_77180/m.174588 type:complete len:80 (-) Transcript_77180:107-346(-)
MSSLGPLPPIGQSSLPQGLSQADWEQQFKSSLKGKTTPFPDASTTALSGLARELSASKRGGGDAAQGQAEANSAEQHQG